MELKLNSVIIIAVLLSANVFADNIPNTFEAGEAIKASEMNENFVDLQNQIDVLKAQVDSYSQSEDEDVKAFVGLTLAVTSGSAGSLYGINQMCSIEYPESSMCNSDDLKGINPALITENAWVEPVLISVNTEGGGYTYYNYGRVSSRYTLDCKSWVWAVPNSSPVQYGAVISTNGTISNRSCLETAPVACCK